MRKYKQCIQVDNNITEIMMLPCVIKCEKEKVEFTTRLLSGSVFSTVTEHELCYILDNGKKAYNGDWIMQDVCNHWCVMSNDDYEKHKDDEI